MNWQKRLERLEDLYAPPPPPVAIARSAVEFVTQELCPTPDAWQADALQAIEDNSHVCIRSGHDVGKTALISWAAIWFILTRQPCVIPVVANTQQQLRDVTWLEIQRWIRKLRPELRQQIEIGADRIWITGNPALGYMVARTASKERPEALQGFHSPNLLFLLEEASGIDEIVFEVARGALASKDARVLMVGNPTRNSGYFHKAFHAGRAMWCPKHVPWAPRPWTNPNYGKEVAEEYGEQSNVYRVRVLGEFPISMDDAVIPLEWIEAAIGRDVDPKPHRSIVWGVDVGRGGDPSALIKRWGNHVLEAAKLWRDADTMVVAGRIAREWAETPHDIRPTSINIDVIGIGAGVHDRLAELGLPVVGINVGETQSLDEPERFTRLRDELWFKARDWFHAKDVKLPVGDELLVSELSAPTYKIQSSGKILVESKDELKARGLHSPNAADAFCLTFAGGEHSAIAKWHHHALSERDGSYRDDEGRAVGPSPRQDFADET